ncbi:MAG: sugar transferase [Planctomycetes bacterium]|nr:sugar transferase [Planctomycetota bacterium]
MISIAGLTIGSVVLIPAMIAIWLDDFCSPLFIAERLGLGGVPFRMVKLRSMRVVPAKEKVLSTAANDTRITRIGRLVRALKLDELTQLWNVLRGEMSLVGPRPQVPRDVARYTEEEKELLKIRPGITDLASIVFADEGKILRGASDPDTRYDAVIRPWKSRLALVYVRRHPSLLTDLRIIWLTILSAVNRQYALDRVSRLVRKDGSVQNW